MRIGLVVILLTVVVLSGCGGSQSSSGASQAVENYYQAMVERNDERFAGAACADWEEQALLEYDSFAGVKIELDGVTCQETGKEGDVVLVACDGKIVASYGNEKMDFPLAERTHRVQNEGGDWRVCGY